MLQAIRERVTGIVAIFVLGLLAIPFLFFGVESYIRDVPQDSVAKVGDLEITVSEFQTEFARHRARMREEMGDAYDDLAINRPESRREFLENMIDERLLRLHAQKLGLEISPSALLDIIRQIPAFQVEGQFDPEFYRQRLRAVGQSPRQFEQDLRRDLLLRELPTAIATSAIVTPAEIDQWLTIQQETRQVTLVNIDSAPYRDPDGVTEAEIEAFYAENTHQFMRDERVTIEYVELDSRDMVIDLDVEEAELRQRYEAVRARYMTPERRRAAHILITEEERDFDQARELAWSLRERIAEGQDFAELAAEYSEDPGSARDGGDLGWIEPDVMVEAFEDVLFALEAGEVSEPVHTEFGWHLIRLVEVDPPRGMAFEEARYEILDELLEEQADDLYYELLERMVDLVYADPTSLEHLVEELNLEIATLGPITRGSGEGIAAHGAVEAAIFSDLVLLDRQASEPIEIDRNRAVVVRAIEHEPARPRPLDAVADEIREQISRERALQAARERGEELAGRAGPDGQQLAEIAEAEDLQIESLAVSRRDFQLGSRLLDELFRLPAPGETPQVHLVPRSGGWTLVRLESVTPGDPAASDEAQRRSARQQLQFNRSNQEIAGLMAWLRANTDIRVVEERLN